MKIPLKAEGEIARDYRNVLQELREKASLSRLPRACRLNSVTESLRESLQEAKLRAPHLSENHFVYQKLHLITVV